MPGPSDSGRVSRQSDALSDRVSMGTTMALSGNEGDGYRYELFALLLHQGLTISER